LLKDRILLTADWYRNRSSSQLVNYTVPTTTGFGSILENLPAVVGNQGWEFLLNTVNIKSKNFTWSSSLNFTIPRNKLVSFPNFDNSAYANTYVIGQPLSVHKVFKYLGVDPQTGVYTFADKNGKPTANPTLITDQTSVVNTDRVVYGGLSNTFRYHGLQLIVTLQYVKQKATDPSVYTGVPPGGPIGYNTQIMSRWQKPGDKSNFQQFTQDYSSAAYVAANNAVYSQRAYIDASFLRAKNVALSYDFGKRTLAGLHSKGIRVYVNAQNLFTSTRYPANDPENGPSNTLPPLRTIVGGIQCSF
jgi:TonB-dependent starch-binding outer membrane protein SusC